MNKVAVIHYAPIELYPPTTNFLNTFNDKQTHIYVFTCYPKKNLELYVNDKISIKRFPMPGQEFVLTRLFKYFYFNLSVFFSLIKIKPRRILYYETYSAFPVYLYKKFINSSVEVYIHCHEYFSPEWWKTTSMRLMQYYNKKEVGFLYPRAAWLSQTNAKRLELFLQDIGLPEIQTGHIYPNYPPQHWRSIRATTQVTLPVRIVYVGSFGSMKTLYIKEVLEWIKAQNGKALLDIYSIEIPAEIIKYINGLNCEYIQLKGAVPYTSLPQVLSAYHVGLILYKGTTKNFIYNAPNKLFEYLVCGLDVWYPQEIEGIYPYDSAVQWPKVLRLNFSALCNYHIEQLIERTPGNHRTIQYTCEEASTELITMLKK